MKKPIEPRRYDYPWWRDLNRYYWRQLWDEFDPQLWDAFVERNNRPGVSHAIDARTTELLVTAIDTVIGYPEPYLDAHIHAAMDLGVSVRELYELVNVCSELYGAHATTNGMSAIARVVLTRTQLGEPVIESLPEKDASAAVSPLAGDQTWRRLLGKHDPARLAAMDEWTEKMIAVRELAPKTQQLIVVTICTALKLTQASMEAQIRRAFDLGLSKEEIIEAIMTVGWLEGVHAAEHGLIAYDAVVGG